VEHLPPWFYESHAIGPGHLQQLYLNVMRRMSAAPSLPQEVHGRTREATTTRQCETLVVGGGEAGVAAARSLGESGRRVVLVEAQAFDALDQERQPSSGAPLASAALEPKVTMLDRTLCVGLYEGPRRALCVGPAGNAVIYFNDLVVATGAYDRLPTVAGNDVPGIVGIRGFERLTAMRAIADGTVVGVYGLANETKRALAAAARAGVNINFLAGPSEDLPDAPMRRFPSSRLLEVHGVGSLVAVELSGAGRLPCDLLVTGFSQPSYELQAQNGCAIELRGDPPVVWPRGSGRAPMAVVGEAAGWFDNEHIASRSALAVAQWLDGTAGALPAPDQASVDRAPLNADAFVCLCEDVRVRDVRAAIDAGYRDVELVKRHTGAGTGPCQGKLCHGALLGCAADAGLDVRIPTPRPLVRPVSIADLAGSAADRT